MFEAITDWMDCGARQRRAIITASSQEMADAAKVYYDSVTNGKVLDTNARIDRGLYVLKEFGASYTHEYTER